MDDLRDRRAWRRADAMRPWWSLRRDQAIGGRSGVSIRRVGRTGAFHVAWYVWNGIAAATRGSSGRHAVPRQAERSHEAGVQQSHGISCVAAISISSSQGISAIAAAIRAVAASCSTSPVACIGATSVVAIIVMITSQCRAAREIERKDMDGF